jgi:aminoglycoside phosphotransferase (APT) family kinase protein
MPTDWRDRPSPVRSGEELDVEKLSSYLKAHLPDLDRSLIVEQFPHGYSNLTYRLRFGDRELVLRRPPLGAKIKTAHDMGREYTILSHLIEVYPKVPRPLLYCQDESVLGSAFYVMTRLEGVIMRPQMPEEMVPPSSLMKRIAGSFIDNLVDLHAVDHRAAGLGDLGRPEGYVERQIRGWTKRYYHAKTDDIDEMERAGSWLADHMPPESGAGLIHNDYKYDNIVLDPADWAKIIGVLDWEMATIGDPLMDLGSSLGYWVQSDDPEEIQALRFSPTTLPGNPSRQELVERYIRKSGIQEPDMVFYYVYGLFKLAVIVQQIYARYKLGYTQDPRFADLILAVRACGHMAIQATTKKRIDQLVN